MNKRKFDTRTRKKCYFCGSGKRLDHFRANPDKKDGLHNVCRECEKLEAPDQGRLGKKKDEEKVDESKKVWLHEDEIYC